MITSPTRNASDYPHTTISGGRASTMLRHPTRGLGRSRSVGNRRAYSSRAIPAQFAPPEAIREVSSELAEFHGGDGGSTADAITANSLVRERVGLERNQSDAAIVFAMKPRAIYDYAIVVRKQCFRRRRKPWGNVRGVQ